ncbi:MAG: glycoside hydrolase family 15 protein [Acidimicrobiales bacterium]
MITNADRVPIGARSWIGDGGTGAAVAADGTIDWYCSERFDAPAALGRLLDPAAGAVRVGPRRVASDSRRRLPPARQEYVEATTTTRTTSAGPGFVTVTDDLMPWPGSGATPPGRIIRMITARSGPVDVELEVVPGTAYGPARSTSVWSEGMAFGSTVVRSGLEASPVALDRDHILWRAVRRLDLGETMVVTIDQADHPHHHGLSPDAAHRLAEDTTSAWRTWLGGLTYQGPYRAQVERAALTLKALTWYRGGAPVAAGTAGLPRRAGGERNSDGRMVPWRLAAGVAGVLGRIGFAEDAEAAEAWLRGAVESSAPPWPTFADVEGGPVPEGEELPVAGWRRSQPVTVGGPTPRLDLDLYGDVAGAISASGRHRSDGAPDGAGPLSAAWPALVAGADWLGDHWRDSDSGVWGLGGPSRELVASKVQAWVALDRMVRTARAVNPLDLDAAGWQLTAAQIASWCEAEGLAMDGGLRLEPSPEDLPDAALLRVAWSGPWPPDHPIVVRTVDRIIEQLSVGLLVHRYPTGLDDGIDGSDSPDVEASLWAVRALARLERWDQAHARMEAVCSLAGPCGLLTSAADPASGELLGNLPDAGAHLALIQAAIALQEGPT